MRNDNVWNWKLLEYWIGEGRLHALSTRSYIKCGLLTYPCGVLSMWAYVLWVFVLWAFVRVGFCPDTTNVRYHQRMHVDGASWWASGASHCCWWFHNYNFSVRYIKRLESRMNLRYRSYLSLSLIMSALLSPDISEKNEIIVILMHRSHVVTDRQTTKRLRRISHNCLITQESTLCLKKRPTLSFAVTLTNTDRFSILFSLVYCVENLQ